MELTDKQIDFIVDNYFLDNNEDEVYAGARNIAISLVSIGECLTTDQAEPIWVGGMGNFLDIKFSDVGVGLIKITFDLENFLKTPHYILKKRLILGSLERKRDKIDCEINLIKDLPNGN